MSDPHEHAVRPGKIVTRCPACGRDTLFIGHGGHLTCGWLTCPNPSVSAWIDMAKVKNDALSMQVDQLLDELALAVLLFTPAQARQFNNPFNAGEDRREQTVTVAGQSPVAIASGLMTDPARVAAALAGAEPPIEPAAEPEDVLTRIRRFKNTTGALYGGRTHPDRCVCQGDDDTPHQHYADRPPYSCARCGHKCCAAYTPAVPSFTPAAAAVASAPRPGAAS